MIRDILKSKKKSARPKRRCGELELVEVTFQPKRGFLRFVGNGNEVWVHSSYTSPESEWRILNIVEQILEITRVHTKIIFYNVLYSMRGNRQNASPNDFPPFTQLKGCLLVGLTQHFICRLYLCRNRMLDFHEFLSLTELVRKENTHPHAVWLHNSVRRSMTFFQCFPDIHGHMMISTQSILFDILFVWYVKN